MKANRIHKTWFKNQFTKGNLLIKVSGKYTDDYAYDAAINFGKQDSFEPCTNENLPKYILENLFLWGEKNGIINGSFASCNYYEFKVK